MGRSDENFKQWTVVVTTLLGLVPLAVTLTVLMRRIYGVSPRTAPGVAPPPPTVSGVSGVSPPTDVNVLPQAAGVLAAAHNVEEEEEDLNERIWREMPSFFKRPVEDYVRGVTKLAVLPDDDPDRPYDEEEANREYETPGTIRFIYKSVVEQWAAANSERKADTFGLCMKYMQLLYPHLYLGVSPPGHSHPGEESSSSSGSGAPPTTGHDETEE